MFLETSALTGEHVVESFLQCARMILSKVESGISNYLFYNKQIENTLCFRYY